VPKLGRARSEKKSATCPAAGTSQIGRTLTLRPRSGTDGLAPSPQLGGRWRLQGFPCSSRRTPCSCSQGIGRYSRGKAREFRLCFQQESQISEKFPVFSLLIRDMASETSSLQTGSSAIQSASPGFGRPGRVLAPKNPVVSRVLGEGPGEAEPETAGSGPGRRRSRCLSLLPSSAVRIRSRFAPAKGGAQQI